MKYIPILAIGALPSLALAGDGIITAPTKGASIQTQSTPSKSAKLILAGLTINQKNHASIDVLRVKSDTAQTHYYLPCDILTDMGIVLQDKVDQILAITPLGQTAFEPSDFYDQSRAFISLSALKKLGITAYYHTQDNAVHILMATPPKTKNAKSALIPTHFPKQLGLFGIHLHSNITHRPNDTNTTKTTSHTNMGAFGYLFGGSFGVNVGRFDNFTGDTNTKSNQLNNAYFSQSFDHVAYRLGNSADTLSTQTGLAVAYSNKSIDRHLAKIDSHTTGLLTHSDQNLTHIKGVGLPAGIAELIVNGQKIARVQSKLDGRYEFLNLDTNRLNHTSMVQVALYDNPFATTPTRTETITIGRRKSTVATDEWLLQGSIGKQGIWQDGKLMSSISAEYGINNQLAVRSGLRFGDDVPFWRIGANYSPNAKLNIDLEHQSQKYASRHSGVPSWALTIEQLGKHTATTYQYQKAQIDRHRLSTRWNNDRFSATLSHYYDDKDGYHANISIQKNRPNYSTGINFESKNDRFSAFYRQNLRHYDRPHINIGYRIDNTSHSLSANWQKNGINVEQGVQHFWRDRSNQYHGVGLFGSASMALDRHFETVNNAKPVVGLGRLSANYRLYDNQLQGSLLWQYSNKGINVDVGYHLGTIKLNNRIWHQDTHLDNQRTSNTDQSKELFVRVHLDGYQPPHQALSLGRYTPSKLGSVGVSLDYPEPLAQARFLVDDKLITARNIGNTKPYFVLEDLPKGNHKISLDSKTLPIEYQTPAPVVAQVVNHAPTLVQLTPIKHFGIHGKLDDKLKDKGDLLILLYQDGKLIDQSITSNGRFSFDGLKNGTYTLQGDHIAPTQLVIDNDYILGVILESK